MDFPNQSVAVQPVSRSKAGFNERIDPSLDKHRTRS